MGEFNVDKTDGSLLPTAGYGGMIKITGTTLASLVSALNNMTSDQCNRCTIEILGEDLRILRSYICVTNTGKPTCYNLMQTSASGYIEVRLDVTVPSYGKYIYDGSSRTYEELEITSWNILYQDDSIFGGNTYPASQVSLSGGGNIEDALSAKANLTDLATKADSEDVTSRENIAKTFSESTAYTKGSLVWYNNNLYEFTSDHAAGAWNNSHAKASTVSASINRRNLATFIIVATVTADGVKTYSELLDSIYSSRNSLYILDVGGVRMQCGFSSTCYGIVWLNSSGNVYMYAAFLKSSGSIYKVAIINSSTGAIAVSDLSSIVPNQGITIRFLRYGAIN